MNKDVRNQILEAYQIIHKLDITDAAKSKLVDLVDEALETHDSITLANESTKEALVRMSEAQEAQSEDLKKINDNVTTLSRHMTALKALLTKGKERIDA